MTPRAEACIAATLATLARDIRYARETYQKLLPKSTRYTLKLNRRIQQAKDTEAILGALHVRLTLDLHEHRAQVLRHSYDPVAVPSRQRASRPSKPASPVRHHLQFTTIED